MKQALLIMAAALFVRLWGAALRRDRPVYLSSVGWMACGLSAWLAVSAIGGWTPLGIGIAAGLIGAVMGRRMAHPVAFFAFDAATVGLCARFSSPPFAVLPCVLLAVMAAAVGAGLDALVNRTPEGWTSGGRWFPLALILGTAPLFWPTYKAAYRYVVTTPGHLMSLGIAPVSYQNAVVLPTGAVAWLDVPSGPRVARAALFFHGAQMGGSHQSTAVAIRNALTHLGITVLAVDHPGYGQSPTPPVEGDVAQWDPLPTAMSALAALRERAPSDDIFIVAHSMGCLDALRLMRQDVPVSGVVLFGAGFDGKDERYRYRRFHVDRRLKPGALTREQYQEIRQRYYNGPELLRELPADHPPVVFVAFDHEHADLAATRQSFFDALPGRKIRVDFGPSTHYMNTIRFNHVMLGDVSLWPRLVSRFTDDFDRLVVSIPGSTDHGTYALNVSRDEIQSTRN